MYLQGNNHHSCDAECHFQALKQGFWRSFSLFGQNEFVGLFSYLPGCTNSLAVG